MLPRTGAFQLLSFLLALATPLARATEGSGPEAGVQQKPIVATPVSPEDSARPGTPASRHRLMEFSLDVSKFDYVEDFPAPGKSTENGVIPGLFFSFRHQESPASNFWSIALEISPGGTRYDGTTQAPKYTPVQQNTANLFYRAEFDYAFNIFCSGPDDRAGCLKLYLGLGGRLWIRGQSTVTDTVASPSEHYWWLYIPLGGRYEKQLSENWDIAIDASLRPMLPGLITVAFSQVASNYQDSTGSLGMAIGGRIEVPVRRKISERIDAQITPWFERSSIGQGGLFDIVSNGGVSEQGFEPSSRTYQYGARFGITYTY